MSKEQDSEVTVFIDFLPNLVKLGQMKTVEDILRKKYEASLPSKIVQYGKLPYLIIKLGPFQPLIEEARQLYVDGYYRAAVALCGMTAECLCIAIAEEREKLAEYR